MAFRTYDTQAMLKRNSSNTKKMLDLSLRHSPPKSVDSSKSIKTLSLLSPRKTSGSSKGLLLSRMSINSEKGAKVPTDQKVPSRFRARWIVRSRSSED